MCDSGGGGSAPAPDPLIGQAAKANAQTAQEALSWYKDVYANQIAPLAKQQQDTATKLATKQIETMDKQNAFADDQNKSYKENFQPIEKQVASDAMSYDSADNVARRSGIAGADVTQSYSNVTQQNARNLARYGLNPNSSAFAATNDRLLRSQALDTAGAQTGAAFDTQDKAISLRAGAANFGRNMPNTASNFYSSGTNSGNSALNANTTAANTAMAGANVMNNGFGTAIQGNSSAGNLMLGQYSGAMQGYQANATAQSGMYQGLGTLAGLAISKADGGHIHEGEGHVRGIGGPVDDKIPAMLSNGEYVIPADVVRAKGVEFFDKIKDKYHTPAAVQRRQALSRG